MTEKLKKLPNPLYPLGIILYSILGLASDVGYFLLSPKTSDNFLFLATKIKNSKILGSQIIKM